VRSSAAAASTTWYSEDANVSRQHAEIRPTPDGHWTVADLGSTNGVQVNGRPTIRARRMIAPATG
jgi:pSer/pThr/pTyr-binding forkhead associated (FHA) protein